MTPPLTHLFAIDLPHQLPENAPVMCALLAQYTSRVVQGGAQVPGGEGDSVLQDQEAMMVRLQGELAMLKHNMDSEVSQAREEALSVMQITGGEGLGLPWTLGLALPCLQRVALCCLAPVKRRMAAAGTCTVVPTACRGLLLQIRPAAKQLPLPMATFQHAGGPGGLHSVTTFSKRNMVADTHVLNRVCCPAGDADAEIRRLVREAAAAQSARMEAEGELQRCRSAITELQAALAAAQVRGVGVCICIASANRHCALASHHHHSCSCLGAASPWGGPARGSCALCEHSWLSSLGSLSPHTAPHRGVWPDIGPTHPIAGLWQQEGP